MKANAPEKIWLDSRSVFLNKPNKSGLTEYTRTDTFIEKVFKFFDKHLWEYIDVKNDNYDTHIHIDSDELKEDFKTYMKEE